VAHISILIIEFINKPKDKQSLFVVDLMQSAGKVLAGKYVPQSYIYI